MAADVYSQAVLGYRAFSYSLSGLHSAVFYKQTWQAGDNHALCLSHAHPAPAADCECGFYAIFELDDLTAYDNCIIAAVIGKGDAHIHNQGFRVQTARVIALLMPQGRKARMYARFLARRYNVPLFEERAQLSEYAQQYGAPVPAQLRPAADNPMHWSFGRTRDGFLSAVAAVLCAVGMCAAFAAMIASCFVLITAVDAHSGVVGGKVALICWAVWASVLIIIGLIYLFSTAFRTALNLLVESERMDKAWGFSGFRLD